MNQREVLELKNIIIEIKISVEKFNSKFGQAAKTISEHKNRSIEIKFWVAERMKKNEQSLRDLWNTRKKNQ